MKSWVALALVSSLCMGCGEKAEPKKTAVQRLNERLEAETEKEAQAKLDRMDALDQAKAVAIAAIDASEERDQRYPSPQEWKAWVGPLLKADQKVALDRFEWTFPGGKATEIDQIAETELGHIGDVIAYADGSVRVKF